jgi:hypothetical protein
MVGRVLLAALLAAGLASAQGRGGGSRGGGGGDLGMNMPRPQSRSKLDQISEKLKLNKEQKAEVENILNGALETAGPLAQQIGNGRQMITEAMVNGKDSGDDYNKLMAAYTAVLAQMDSVEATAYGKIYALLKPNQQKNAEMVFSETMAGMFMRSGGRGGEGGRRTRDGK